MDYKVVEVLCDKKESSKKNEATELTRSMIDLEGVSDPIPSSPGNNVQMETVDWKAGGIAVHTPTRDINFDSSREVYMEASITPDDVIRAGGFGARDEIGSFLPVASDSTDFEATIRDARDYEEPQGEIRRPGLGWTGAKKPE